MWLAYLFNVFLASFDWHTIVHCYLATHVNSVLGLAILFDHSPEAIVFCSCLFLFLFLFFLFLLLALPHHFVLLDGITHLGRLSLSLILVASKFQVDVRKVDFPVYLFVVVIFSVCSPVLEPIHVVFESEGQLVAEQGHRQSVVLGFLLLDAAAFGLVHNLLQMDILIINYSQREAFVNTNKNKMRLKLAKRVF